MKCSQCGREFTEEEIAAQNGVCPECGCKMNNQPKQEAEQTETKEESSVAQSQNLEETESAKKEKKKKRF